MPDRMMFYEDTYVLLSPSLEQRFVNLAELKQVLGELLSAPGVQLPPDLLSLDRAAQIDRLIDTVCEFESGEGTWQWYVVRLEK